MRPLFSVLIALSLLVIVSNGCGSGTNSISAESNLSAINTVYSETEYQAGIIHGLVPGRSIYFELEGINIPPVLTDTGSSGVDEFAISITEDTTIDACSMTNGQNYTISLLDEEGNNLLNQTSSSVENCNLNSSTPIQLAAGNYTIRISQNSEGNSSFYLILKLEEPSSNASVSSNSRLNASTGSSSQLSVAPPSPYDITQTYQANTVVTYKNATYVNGWWANPGQCPVQLDCISGFTAGLWKVYDPSVKHEFAYYNYPALKASYPTTPDCSENDYNLSTIQSLIDASISSGEMSHAAPSGGYNSADKEALYREYMLTCSPNLSTYTPANVALVQSIITPAVWDALASKIYTGDASLFYMDADAQTAPWPAEANYKAESYNNFLTAIARYPYFCGEQGYFSSIEEACKRELSSLFAHASQETGNTDVTQSFYWLREYGYVNGATNSYFNTGCAKPFDCTTNGFARFYGRGPNQLTYFYNYAGFSAAYFNGNYNFLLLWPDLVAYDGEMYFQTVIFFVMSNQPPKPSIHDILLGRYQPSACVSTSDCAGLQYDATTGVLNNFDITIEAVNGGVECRPSSEEQYKQAAQNRSTNYKGMLTRLNATLSDAENNLPLGCEFITYVGNSLFDQASAQSGLQTWLDMSQTSCLAQSLGGTAMVSVTAPGIVDACRNR